MKKNGKNTGTERDLEMLVLKISAKEILSTEEMIFVRGGAEEGDAAPPLPPPILPGK